jgi:hypothetical protein
MANHRSSQGPRSVCAVTLPSHAVCPPQLPPLSPPLAHLRILALSLTCRLCGHTQTHTHTQDAHTSHHITPCPPLFWRCWPVASLYAPRRHVDSRAGDSGSRRRVRARCSGWRGAAGLSLPRRQVQQRQRAAAVTPAVVAALGHRVRARRSTHAGDSQARRDSQACRCCCCAVGSAPSLPRHRWWHRGWHCCCAWRCRCWWGCWRWWCWRWRWCRLWQQRRRISIRWRIRRWRCCSLQCGAGWWWGWGWGWYWHRWWRAQAGVCRRV